MKNLKKFIPFICLSILIFSTTASAKNNITVSCEITKVDERSSTPTTKSLTFDTDKGYKKLSLVIYGSKVEVSSSLYLSADGKTCGNMITDICVGLSNSSFCTDKTTARLYPQSESSQPGDETFIDCKIVDNKEFECPSED